MLCIYCKVREADAREHYLPQCLGRVENFQPLMDRLCDTCNHEIGGEVERDFCRRSPEAVLRSIHSIKGQQRGGQNKRPAHIYQPERIVGRHMYMFGVDMDGRNILRQFGEQPGTVKEISQVVILDADDNAVEHIAIPIEITTEILFKKRDATFIDKALVIAASGDEERVQALFSEINCNIPMQRRKGGTIPQQFFKGEITPAYFRATLQLQLPVSLRNSACWLIGGNTSQMLIASRCVAIRCVRSLVLREHDFEMN